jgi:hypothetical protein
MQPLHSLICLSGRHATWQWRYHTCGKMVEASVRRYDESDHQIVPGIDIWLVAWMIG